MDILCSDRKIIVVRFVSDKYEKNNTQFTICTRIKL